jgi:hypothetical protein
VARGDGAFEVNIADATGQPIAIAGGDALDAAWTGADLRPPDDAGSAIVVALPITATLDATARILRGRAPPESPVVAILHGMDGTDRTTTLGLESNARGVFSATVGSGAPGAQLPAGAWADVATLDADGHRTYVIANVPFLELVIASPVVAARAAPLGDHILELRAGDVTVARAEMRADTLGAFETLLAPVGAGDAAIASGEEVVLVEPGGRRTTVVVPDLSVTIDRDARAVRGRAPALTTVNVRLFVPGQTITPVAVLASDLGLWSLPESALPGGVRIDRVLDADAWVTVASGHRVTARVSGGARPTVTPGASATPTGPTATATADQPTPTVTPETSTPTTTPTPTIWLPMAFRSTAPAG